MKEKRYLMVDDYRLDKVLYIIKEMIVIKKFDNTKMLVDTDDRLPMVKTKDDGKFYSQLFLEEVLLLKYKW